MLLATVGDILTIRKQYQKTFQLNSDESADDSSLTCFDINKFKELLEEYDPEEPLLAPILLEMFESSIVEVPIASADNFFAEISDPGGGGSSNIGYSGKDKYDLMNYYEPESLDDNRHNEDPNLNLPKAKAKSTNSIYNQTRTTSTGRKAYIN